MNPDKLFYVLNGTNEVIINKTLLFNREIKISIIGSGAGVLGYTIFGSFKEGAAYDMSKELEQIAQVNRDQVGAASAGNEYYRIRRSSTTPKQVSINPYNP